MQHVCNGSVCTDTSSCHDGIACVIGCGLKGGDVAPSPIKRNHDASTRRGHGIQLVIGVNPVLVFMAHERNVQARLYISPRVSAESPKKLESGGTGWSLEQEERIQEMRGRVKKKGFKRCEQICALLHSRDKGIPAKVVLIAGMPLSRE